MYLVSDVVKSLFTITARVFDLIPVNNFGSLVHNELKFVVHIAHLGWCNEYAWNGKGPGFESDQEQLFFKRLMIRFKKCRPNICLLMFYRLSCLI